MKRKFTFLLAALVALTTASMFVSCKDNDEDLYNDLRLQQISDNATLKEAFETQNAILQGQLDQLKAELAAVNSCTCDKEALRTELNKLTELITALQNGKADKTVVDVISDAVDKLKTDLAGKADQSTVDTLTTAVDKLKNDKADKTTVNTLSSAIDKMKTDLAGKADQSTVDLLKTAVETLKDQMDGKADKDIVDSLTIKLNEVINNYASVADLETAKKELQTAIDTINEALAKIKQCECTPFDDSAILERLSLAEQAIIDANNLAQRANDRLDNLEPRVVNNTDAIQKLLLSVDNLNIQIISMGEKLAEAYKTASNAYALAVDDSLRADALKAALDSVKGDVAGNTADIEALQQAVNDLDQRVQNNTDAIQELIKAVNDVNKNYKIATAEALQEAKTYADQQIATAKSELTDLMDAKVGTLRSEMEQADKELQNQIDDLKNRVDKLEGDLQALLKEVEVLKDKMGKMVTSLTVQTCYNPMFGNVNTPVGVNTNILLAYYGSSINDVEFPTAKSAVYAYPAQALTAQELAMMGGVEKFQLWNGEQTLSDANDNAGRIYLTVNPSTVDFTGLTINLANSQGKDAGIELSPLHKTDKVLEFGITRAASNGFYEANAKVTNINAVQKIDIDKKALAGDVKEIINKRQNADFQGMASDLYQLVRDFRLDANAASVTDPDNRSIFSQYSVAATAFKPLSLSSLDFNRVTMPGYDRAMNLIDKIFNKVKNLAIINEGMEKFAHAEYVGMKTEKVDTIITDPNATITAKDTVILRVTLNNVDRDGNPTGTTEQKIIELPGEDVIYAIYGTIDYVQTGLTTNVQDLVDFLYDAVKSITDMIDLAQNKATSVLEKVNSVAVKFINGINERLQPVIVYTDNGKGGILTGARANAPVLKAGFDLIPTTWNYELLVPIYKKHVAVVNAWDAQGHSAQQGNSACKSAVDQANKGMNKVIDGNERHIDTSKMKAGFTYEIAYTALDYHGVVGIYRGYVTIK